jgi:hypothetical protein
MEKRLFGNFTLSLQKLEGSRVKATGGEAVVGYCEPPATQDLESSGFPGGEKRWHKIDPILKFTIGLFLTRRLYGVHIQCPKGCANLLPSFLCNYRVYKILFNFHTRFSTHIRQLLPRETDMESG